jgi:DNA-binding response OmpR family regulator
MDPATKSRVLVVEEDDSVRMLMRLLLERDGWLVLVARGADEALAVSALAGEIRLLVTDVHLGESSGPALHRQLRQSHPDLEALLVSSDSRESLIGRGVLDSQCEFLRKPFTPHELVRRARAVAPH